MKRLVFAFAILAGFASGVRAENLIPFNEGFELGSPAGWYMWIDEKTSGNASFQTVDKNVHSGGYALEFDVKRSTRDIWQIALSIPKWKAQPNTRYLVKIWAKGPGAVKINASDTDRNYAWMGGFGTNLSPTEWTEVSGEVVTTTQSGDGKVSLAIGVGQAVGKYYFDDVSVEALGPVGK